MNNFSIKGNVVDIFNRKIYAAEVFVDRGKILAIQSIDEKPLENFKYILPGFIDSHVHIESSMLVPSEFARLAVVHGTVATISDPHEIANVCGMAGVDFMIENGKTVPFKFNFGAPSCVPATSFETAGAVLNSNEVKALLQRDDIKYLSEMMNFPGVLNGDEEVMKKIEAAHARGKPVDGHAPGLRGEKAKQYINAGISTDHECFTAEEALDKLQMGMKVLIREGSAAKNFEALIPLLNDWPDMIMFCSDDKHPDSLAIGHIDQLCARAVTKGVEVFNILQAACVNPVLHYKLNVGLLRENDCADFILVNDLKDFKVQQTYIDGVLVAADGKSNIQTEKSNVINHFNCKARTVEEFEVLYNGEKSIDVIEALDGQLITNRLQLPPKVVNGKIECDIESDILKIIVINRYQDASVAKAWIKNFGFRKGAIASSIAHDSHNIIAVGTNDNDLCRAVNLVIAESGGVSCVNGVNEKILSLPVAGLMSNEDGYAIAKSYTEIDEMAKQLGSDLAAPFMTLSFMALLVIPHLKLSDKGLFNGDDFCFVKN